jgi:primosomal protein N' (replication factor Y)
VKGGRVLVQTLSPDHPAIAASVRHDYLSFVKREMDDRAQLGYPPFGAMIRLVVRSQQESAASHTAAGLADRLRQAAESSNHPTHQVRILGPGEAAIAKLRGQYRFQLQLQATEISVLQQLVRQVMETFKVPRDVICVVDVDPWDMM